MFGDSGDDDVDWDDLKQIWADTRETRLGMWQSDTSGLTTADIYRNFALLSNAKCDDLIFEDFDHLYPTATETYQLWVRNYKKVLTQARNYRDDYAKALINNIDLMDRDFDHENVEVLKSISTLPLIPYILAPNGRRTVNGSAATKNDIQESFISIFEVS